MKATLEFNLNEHEDVMAHKRCVKSLDMAIALFHITTTLMDKVKHLEEIAEETELDLADFIIAEINAIMEDNSINIEELVS